MRVSSRAKQTYTTAALVPVFLHAVWHELCYSVIGRLVLRTAITPPVWRRLPQ